MISDTNDAGMGRLWVRHIRGGRLFHWGPGVGDEGLRSKEQMCQHFLYDWRTRLLCMALAKFVL